MSDSTNKDKLPVFGFTSPEVLETFRRGDYEQLRWIAIESIRAMMAIEKVDPHDKAQENFEVLDDAVASLFSLEGRP